MGSRFDSPHCSVAGGSRNLAESGGGGKESALPAMRCKKILGELVPLQEPADSSPLQEVYNVNMFNAYARGNDSRGPQLLALDAHQHRLAVM